MIDKYKYHAFISYSRNDIEWAKWLQNSLERYRTPKFLYITHPDFPSRLRPIFTDVNDLVAGSLSDILQKSLEDSEFLIVICSPKSAHSKWVNKEVQTFIDLGRADHIIPFVIEGTPFSKDSTTECYPSALLNLNDSPVPLAVNVKELGKDAAFIKVMTLILNVSFDALWDRYKRNRWMYPLDLIYTPIKYLRDWIKSCFDSTEIDKIDNYIPQKDGTDIFISYRRIDGRDVARTIEQALLKEHYSNVFFDYTSIQDGKFNVKIIDAIFSCKDFILVLSPKSMKKCHRKNDWVAREIRMALKYKSHIIPVVIENENGNTIWNWPKNFPKDLCEIKDIEQLPFQMGTYFPDAMRNLINRLGTLKINEHTPHTIKNTDCANLKIKYQTACCVYIDDELHTIIKECNKLAKIQLEKGEYLLRITTLNGEKVLLEDKLNLSRDKLYTDLN